ncbi:MAG: type IV pilus assembly protein PilM [Kiritimatiellia bacterium]
MFKSDRILTLNIGASQIVLAEFRILKSGGLELLSYGSGKLGVAPEEETEVSAYIVSTLRDVMREKKIKPGPTLISISSQIIFSTFVKLPPVKQDKVAQIVRYEAQQNIPAIEEVVWDYQLVAGGEGEMSAMIVAAKIDLVKKLTDCVEAAGLTPEVVDVSNMALYNAMRFNYADLEGCSMILDMGARSTSMIFSEGRKIFSRPVPIAGNAITKELMKEFGISFEEAEALKIEHAYVGFGSSYDESEKGTKERVAKVVRNVMTRLHAEISRTINFYRSQQGGSHPQRLFLAGGSSVIGHLDTFLRDKLKIDVDFLNPFTNVTVNEAIDSEQVARDIVVLGEVVGVALRRVRSCPVEIDLMPPDIVAYKKFMGRLPFFALTGMSVVLALLMWWVFFHRQKSLMQERVASVQAKVRQLESTEVRLKGLKKQQSDLLAKAGELNRQIILRTAWHEALEDLHGKVLEGMWLTEIAFQETAEDPAKSGRRFLRIRGQGFDDKVTQKNISDFAASLKDCRHFTDKQIVTLIKPVDGTDFMTEFVIEADVRDL